MKSVEPENKNYLFVYGTLLNDYNLKLKNRVSSNMQYVGQAKVDASLYDLGKYPGAIKEHTADEVIGDVFLISDPEKVFKILDAYEGQEFKREKDLVKLKSGKSLNAWVYWYNQKPKKAIKIRQKNYLNYLKSKRTA